MTFHKPEYVMSKLAYSEFTAQYPKLSPAEIFVTVGVNPSIQDLIDAGVEFELTEVKNHNIYSDGVMMVLVPKKAIMWDLEGKVHVEK